jgi:hypothetical protein
MDTPMPDHAGHTATDGLQFFLYGMLMTFAIIFLIWAMISKRGLLVLKTVKEALCPCFTSGSGEILEFEVELTEAPDQAAGRRAGIDRAAAAEPPLWEQPPEHITFEPPSAALNPRERSETDRGVRPNVRRGVSRLSLG